MAVIYVANLEDFLGMLRRVGTQRYMLVKEVDEEGKTKYYLIPTVTSRHTHTYVYEVGKEEDVEAIEGAWRGTMISARKVEIAKW